MFDLSIKVKNYKCFTDEAGFDDIQRVNLIIGRNNAGKSSLLEVIEIVTGGKYNFDQATWRDGQPQIIFTASISENVARRTFPSTSSGGKIRGNHEIYGQQYIGRKISWTKRGNSEGHVQLVNCQDDGIAPPLQSSGQNYSKMLPVNMPIPLQGKMFRRVLAERDIIPEGDNGSNISIQPNGVGLTNAIQSFINRSNLPSSSVEVDLLNALNEIFAHDAAFTDIVCQLHENGFWEIYLEEEHKGRVALSNSGSGLKTIITVLACLFLIPELEKKPLSQYIFGFEELENNIHPALLRRLNEYIYKASIENDFIYFLTTHSNVLIDQFSKQDDAQIIHVTQTNAKAKCNTVKTYIENNGILDDLDVRASDLLQANGVVWVEGPSDRVYLNRWIDLWSDGQLKEGTHYQIIFYGGRLLSHLSAESPDDVSKGVSILSTNRNAIIMIDSDKRNRQTKYNATKIRIRDEFHDMGALCWITNGREIENYISSEVVDSFWTSGGSQQVGQYESFFDHVDKLKKGEGAKYANKKSQLSENLIKFMTLGNMKSVLDIDKKMREVCTRIIDWNS